MNLEPPEVAFHRFFQRRPRVLQQGYKGKADLDRLEEANLPVALLEALQAMMNDALQHENVNIPEHAPHHPFHFDYVDSMEPNALAFCGDTHSFVGITIPLLEQLWQSAMRLSESNAIASICDMVLDDAQRAAMTVQHRIQVAVFRLQLFFITLHEFTHIVHAHVALGGAEQGFSHEIVPRGVGNIESQARESDADGYAVYFMLANIVDGVEERRHLLNILVQGNQPIDRQEQILVSWFIVAIAAYFCARPPQLLTERTAYELTHPPQAARMALVMKAIRSWCLQNRPALALWVTPERFQFLLRVAASAMWDMSGGRDWSQQIEFLQSDVGRRYYDTLERRLIELVKASTHRSTSRERH